MSRLKTLFEAGSSTGFCLDTSKEIKGNYSLTDTMCGIHPKSCGNCPLNYSWLERELIRQGIFN